jgi:hypothetical protein
MLRYIFVFKFPLHGVQPINEFIWMRSPFKLQNVNIYVEISLEFMIIWVWIDIELGHNEKD